MAEVSTLEKIRLERIAKVHRLKELGIDPYPAKSNKQLPNQTVTENYDEYAGQSVTLAGRLMSWREHGQLVFADIEDQSGRIQLYIHAEDLQPFDRVAQTLGFTELNLLDVGDIVEATGIITKTQRGEISLAPSNIRLLTKSLRPLPEKWKGIVDPEARFRRRYLDMTMNPEIRQRFVRRAEYWQAVRQFMIDNGFVEVNIPVLEHVTGGADAVPFETHMNALDQRYYLRISHELPLKRLLGGGMEKVFDIGPRFRNEGLSDEHLPEHIAMEFYWAYADFEQGLKFTEELFKYSLEKVYGTLKFNIRGFDVDLSKPWEQIDYADIIKDRFGVDIYTASESDMLAIIKDNKVNLGGEINRNRLIDNLWKLIRKTIAGPAVLVNVPKFMSPLAKTSPANPAVTQRLHPIIAGSELANAYGELNDPLDQFERFMEQQKLRESGDGEAQMLDVDYVEMLEYGMPPAFGFGLSERVFWFFEGVSAKEGVPFPPLREEIDPISKRIYGLEDSAEEADPSDGMSNHVASEPSINTTEVSFAYGDHPSVEDAEKLMLENVSDEYQRLHSRMISKAMGEYAKILAERFPSEAAQNPAAFDPDRWAVTGMIHDWDYGFDPDGHPHKNVSKLTEKGYSPDIVQAVLGHKLDLNVPRTTRMAQALVAIDELAGLMFAYSKMKGGYKDMDVRGVLKKFKDKAFAAKINRDDIRTGVEELGLSMDEHVANMLRILQQD